MPTTSAADSPQYAIIGGGISGLAAAYRLSKFAPNAQLTLLEGTDRLGGVLETNRAEGILIERGADSFITRFPWGVELCRELGIESQLLSTSEAHRRALVVRSGKLHPVPEGFVIMRPERIVPLVLSPILSLRGKLRVLTEPWRRRPSQVNEPGFDESVASFARRRLGNEAFERLVQPLLAGIYTADPEKLSLAATMPQFLESERKHGSLLRSVWNARKENPSGPSAPNKKDSGARYSLFVTPRDGLSSMIGALVDQLPEGTVKLGCRVSSIAKQSDGKWTIHTEKSESQPQKQKSPSPDPSQGRGPGRGMDIGISSKKIGPLDGVIVATPAPQTASIVAGLDSQLSRLLGKIEYAGASVVSLVYRRGQIANPLDSFGFVVPSIEGRQIIAASFPSVKFPGRVSEEKVIIRVFLGGALQPELVDLPDDRLQAVATNELSNLLSIRGEPLLVDIARWNEKMPQYHVGHVQLIDEIDHLVAAHDGLELAGNAYRGVGIPQCIHSGQLAAERLIG